jgi:LacI family transcriptional regulator
MKKFAQITLQDIAKKLQVSKVTVSTALRDHPDISAETKTQVKIVAKELGYSPNFFARNLSSQRSGTIGVLVPKIAHHFFSSVIESIYDTALKHNYEVILMISQEDEKREAFHLRTLLSMRVDGLLISASKMTRSLNIFQVIEKQNIPTVFFDRVFTELPFCTVATDDEAGAYQIVKYAIQCGYHRIAHLAGFSHTNIGKNRREGYQKALQEHNIPILNNLIIEGGFSEQDGYKGLMQLHNSGNLPEMVFTVTYPVALGVLSASREIGINIPNQLDVISFGGSDYNKYVMPSITCMEQPTETLGKKATELLMKKILQPEENTIKHLTIPSKIYFGDTCIKKKSIKLISSEEI